MIRVPYRITIPMELSARVGSEAMRRGCSAADLFEKIIEVALRDDMVEAILDGERPGGR